MALDSLIVEAVTAVKASKQGYLACHVYNALHKAGVSLRSPDLDDLVGAMLHVDQDVHGRDVGRSVLQIIDRERGHGRTPSRQLLLHGASASALAHEPEVAAAFCAESERCAPYGRHRPDLDMRASLIRACGMAGQLPRAFDEYKSLVARTGRKPPGVAPANALLSACVESGDLDRAFKQFGDLRGCEFYTVDSGSLTPLLRGCALQGDVRRAERVLKTARKLRIHIHAAAVREFARVGGDEFLGHARRLHDEAVAQWLPMPPGSTTKLARAYLLVGDHETAAEVLGGGPADAEGHAALPNLRLVRSLARQEQQLADVELADVDEGAHLLGASNGDGMPLADAQEDAASYFASTLPLPFMDHET